ncbi:predicted protein [Arabidopsis lyrata subsp. lyrata]|uniref:Predicted protein n=1 Tax=Arabidopsis lyrata subsp. lyrata TaxID=81972 RepID=D7LU83_ARALL|nr:predicted protein [Arabidopsis lyrata subsp. lyrata]
MANVMNEVNIMLYELFLLETGMNECTWVQERLAAGDRLSVQAFLRRLTGTITDVEKKEMVYLVSLPLSISLSNANPERPVHRRQQSQTFLDVLDAAKLLHIKEHSVIDASENVFKLAACTSRVQWEY